VALFGFQFDQSNLSIHSGILASKFEANHKKYLQLDASVNFGNSGGPLIDPETSKVVGIVTRKHTGLTRQFDELIGSFENNIKVLQNYIGSIKVGRFDPVEVLTVTQRQLGIVSSEIARSANVGIGYAYPIERVRQILYNLDEDE
jgi:S1-C subfamily serine protease